MFADGKFLNLGSLTFTMLPKMDEGNQRICFKSSLSLKCVSDLWYVTALKNHWSLKSYSIQTAHFLLKAYVCSELAVLPHIFAPSLISLNLHKPICWLDILLPACNTTNPKLTFQFLILRGFAEANSSLTLHFRLCLYDNVSFCSQLLFSNSPRADSNVLKVISVRTRSLETPEMM